MNRDDANRSEAGPSPVADDSSRKASGFTVFAFFVVGLVGSLITGWIFFPELLYSTKYQPIDFNHKLHMEMVDDGCNSCHYFREDGTFSGIPDLESCMECHTEVMGSDPEEEKFVTEYVEKEKEVPWLVYSRQPDCVFFSHAAHVKGAGIDCASCHGDIGNSEHLRPYQENRLTGYSRDIWGYSIARLGKPRYGSRGKMNDCAACHLKETGSKGSCFQCHK